jgi:glycosidase
MKKITLFALLFSLVSFAQIQRIEPPFWYSNMNHSDLEIMFYGKNIAQFDIAVSNKVVIENIKKTENPNYVFVTIDTKNVQPSELIFSFSSKNKVAFTQKYALKKRREDSKYRKSYDSSDMIYLIMSDRFANGNPNNDSDKSVTEKADRTNPNGRHGGDIQGIINNLDYLKTLGVTAVWPTPLCEDNDDRGSYHTYGQSDVYKIDPRFGTNEEYVNLSTELHKRGMKNIMDYVTNHWGYKHWMMNDLPTYDWIHQFPSFAQTNYRMNTQFDSNASESDAKLFTNGWFVKSMPDLNQSNPLVNNYLIQNAIWWIEYADLDGFRVDTYPYGDKNKVAQWTKAITDEYPNFNIVGEVWYHTPAQNAYWQKDSKIGAIESFNSNLPSVMDFTLQEILNAGVFNENQNAWDQGMVKIYNDFTSDFMYPNINNLLVFVENHDTDRFNEICKNDFAKYKMAMTLIATIRGIPQLYYGSEIGMSGSKRVGDGDIRRDFPGGWNGDTNNAFTASGRTAEQQKFYNYTAKLFNWRKSKSVIHKGKTTHYAPENNTYVFFRSNEKESVMVIINNSNEKQTLKTNRFAENIGNFKSGSDVISGTSYDLNAEITIEAKSSLILELNTTTR